MYLNYTFNTINIGSICIYLMILNCDCYKIYRLLNPVLKRLDKSKQKELESQIQKQFDPVEVNILIFKI